MLRGDKLAIELPDGTVVASIDVRPGMVDWDEPFDLVHRGTIVGRVVYEEVAVFFLDRRKRTPSRAPARAAEGLVKPARPGT